MSQLERMRAVAVGMLIAVSLALVASVAGGDRPAHASGTEGPRFSMVTLAGSGGFGPGVQQRGSNGQDVLEKALLTVAAAGAAALVGLVGYVVRRRVGFWLHRPQTREDGAAEEHH